MTFTFILAVAVILLTAIVLFRKRDKFFSQLGTSNEKFLIGTFTKSLIIPGFIFLIVIFQPFTIERVDSSGVGLKINLTGARRGVDNYKYATGWVVVNTWTEQFKEFPTFQQHIVYDSLQVIMKGGFPTYINPTFNYSLRRENIGDMFMNLRLDVKQIEQGWLQTAILSAVGDVANKWEVDSIFNYRENFEMAVIVECNKRVNKWMIVSQLRTNIIPPEALQEAIIAKTQAIQNAEAAEQEAKTEYSRALKKIAIAKGDSASAVIAASGEARAIQLKQQQLTPAYVEYVKWLKADGNVPRVPATILGSSTGIILNR